jgi:hypothetical protein
VLEKDPTRALVVEHADAALSQPVLLFGFVEGVWWLLMWWFVVREGSCSLLLLISDGHVID